MLQINSEITTKSDVILQRGFVYKISRKSVWRSLVEDHSRSITQGRSSIWLIHSSFGLSTSFLAALRAISFMRNAEATMHDPGNASILRCSDTAVEPDAATEHIGKAWLSTSDDVTLIAIFEHFANWYVAMPMVGTCKRICATWTNKRRQLALEELTKLRCWFYKQKLRDAGELTKLSKVLIPISILNRIEALIR